MEKEIQELAIYQAKDGAIELRQDFENENVVWANLNQIAKLFERDKSVILRHIKNIFNSGELNKKVVVAKIATTTKHGAIKGKTQTKLVEYFNLDLILSVGYRVNSKTATEFRKWATKTLKKHITKGYTINKKALKKNYQEFLQVVDDIKLLAQNNQQIKSDDILELVKTFSSTWFNLESYDKQNFPKKGKIKNKEINLQEFAKNLYQEIEVLKKELIQKNEATEMFAQEKLKESLKGILGNVFQSVFRQDAYETIEEKSAHLLYFVIKNHPFNDGNKRTGAFSFVWFLQKMQFDFKNKISPETLTALTLLIAESNPKNKEKMIGLILLLLK